MSSSIDREAAGVLLQRHHEYGPGDGSCFASDVVGSEVQEGDTKTGTGKRGPVEPVAPSETEQDIAPDKIIRPDEDPPEASISI